MPVHLDSDFMVYRKNGRQLIPTGLVIRVYRQPRPEHMPPEYRADIWPLWFVAFAFLHNRKFGGLFLLGLGLEAGLRQLAWLD